MCKSEKDLILAPYQDCAEHGDVFRSPVNPYRPQREYETPKTTPMKVRELFYELKKVMTAWDYESLLDIIKLFNKKQLSRQETTSNVERLLGESNIHLIERFRFILQNTN